MPRAHAQVDSEVIPEAEPETTPLLLLVEDSPDDAYFFQRQLGKLPRHFSLHHVSDGKAAVDLIGERFSQRAKLPDAVFLDLKMPVMNGFEVLEWVQEQPFSSALRITVLSGSDQSTDRDRASRLGASGYLVKPVTSQDLHQVLTHIQ
jgi:CheY-like chemotaxis protein